MGRSPFVRRPDSWYVRVKSSRRQTVNGGRRALVRLLCSSLKGRDLRSFYVHGSIGAVAAGSENGRRLLLLPLPSLQTTMTTAELARLRGGSDELDARHSATTRAVRPIDRRDVNRQRRVLGDSGQIETFNRVSATACVNTQRPTVDACGRRAAVVAKLHPPSNLWPHSQCAFLGHSVGPHAAATTSSYWR